MDYLLCWRDWLENGEDKTVNIFTVSFFGHRIIPEFREAEDREQRLVRDDNSSLIWILPYPTAELRNNMENFEAYYDEIEICGSAASSHPKGAFQIRNRQMVKRSNLVVFYVDHTGGGAYQTMRYAQKEKKNILNLAGEGYGEKE